MLGAELYEKASSSPSQPSNLRKLDEQTWGIRFIYMPADAIALVLHQQVTSMSLVRILSTTLLHVRVFAAGTGCDIHQ